MSIGIGFRKFHTAGGGGTGATSSSTNSLPANPESVGANPLIGNASRLIGHSQFSKWGQVGKPLTGTIWCFNPATPQTKEQGWLKIYDGDITPVSNGFGFMLYHGVGNTTVLYGLPTHRDGFTVPANSFLLFDLQEKKEETAPQTTPGTALAQLVTKPQTPVPIFPLPAASVDPAQLVQALDIETSNGFAIEPLVTSSIRLKVLEWDQIANDLGLGSFKASEYVKAKKAVEASGLDLSKLVNIQLFSTDQEGRRRNKLFDLSETGFTILDFKHLFDYDSNEGKIKAILAKDDGRRKIIEIPCPSRQNFEFAVKVSDPKRILGDLQVIGSTASLSLTRASVDNINRLPDVKQFAKEQLDYQGDNELAWQIVTTNRMTGKKETILKRDNRRLDIEPYLNERFQVNIVEIKKN